MTSLHTIKLLEHARDSVQQNYGTGNTVYIMEEPSRKRTDFPQMQKLQLLGSAQYLVSFPRGMIGTLM